MKLKQLSSLYLALQFSSMSCYDYQLPDPLLNLFLQPITFSRTGVLYFFEKVFNLPEYSETFLPYRFNHFIELVYLAGRTADPQLYCKELSKLWREKYKEVMFVDASAVANFFEELIIAGKNSFKVTTPQTKKAAIVKCVYDSLLNQFHILKQNPEKFLDELSDDIMKITDTSDHLADFLESILNKILWSTEDKDQVFEIFQKLDKLIFKIYKEHSMIDAEGWYRLSNSLICRLRYHIEIAGNELDQTFYDKAITSINNNSLHLLALEELEEGIISRAEFLKQILLHGQIIAHLNKTSLASNF